MSLPGVCFWNGGLDGHGMPHGEGHMTFFHPVTEATLAVKWRQMDHGHVISGPVAQAHHMPVESVDVTATVAHIVDDDWLFEKGPGDKGHKMPWLSLQHKMPPACPSRSVAPVMVVAPTTVFDASELEGIFMAAMADMPPTLGVAATMEPVGLPTLQPAKPSLPTTATNLWKKRSKLDDNVEFKDIEPYLHLPQVEAADKLGFWYVHLDAAQILPCAIHESPLFRPLHTHVPFFALLSVTVLKRACCKVGLGRWPARAINKQTKKKQVSILPNNWLE